MMPLFVTENETCSGLVLEHGFQYAVLQSKTFWSTEEIMELRALITRHRASVIVVDSHTASAVYYQAMDAICPVAVIDDTVSVAFPAHLRINGHIYADRNEYRTIYQKLRIPLPEILIGPAYMPINGIYAEINRTKSAGKRVAFLAGGSDPAHATLQMLRYCYERIYDRDYELSIVIGALNPDSEGIIQMSDALPRVKVHSGLSRLDALFKTSDVAVSAAGITLYELSAAGVPTVAYSLADNQIPVGEAFAARKICRYVGDIRCEPRFFDTLFQSVNELLADECIRETMSNNGKRTVDGHGAYRIAVELHRLARKC